MTDRPIIFSAPMVRALLAGTKTQTRRVVKFKPWHQIEERDDGTPWPWMYDSEYGGDCWIPCPYGQPGDRIWVREAWAWSGDGAVPAADRVRKGEVWFRADPERSSPAIRWRPSIYMPRWASRITLEVTGVRVERLQDIIVADAMAEGVVECAPHLRGLEPCMDWRYAYEDLWVSINGPGTWDANPWVWVIEFKRVTP